MKLELNADDAGMAICTAVISLLFAIGAFSFGFDHGQHKYKEMIKAGKGQDLINMVEHEAKAKQLEVELRK